MKTDVLFDNAWFACQCLKIIWPKYRTLTGLQTSIQLRFFFFFFKFGNFFSYLPCLICEALRYLSRLVLTPFLAGRKQALLENLSRWGAGRGWSSDPTPLSRPHCRPPQQQMEWLSDLASLLHPPSHGHSCHRAGGCVHPQPTEGPAFERNVETVLFKSGFCVGLQYPNDELKKHQLEQQPHTHSLINLQDYLIGWVKYSRMVQRMSEFSSIFL